MLWWSCVLNLFFPVSCQSFCRDCANLMLPSSGEDNRLQYVCRTCSHSEYADDVRVYFHNVEGDGDDVAGDMQPEQIISDPTLPRARVRCANCSGTEAVWFQTVIQDAERMAYGFCFSFFFFFCFFS